MKMNDTGRLKDRQQHSARGRWVWTAPFMRQPWLVLHSWREKRRTVLTGTMCGGQSLDR